MVEKARKKKHAATKPRAGDGPGNGNGEQRGEGDAEFRVQDRRHWVEGAEAGLEEAEAASEPRRPTVVDEYRRRAEEAERQLDRSRNAISHVGFSVKRSQSGL